MNEFYGFENLECWKQAKNLAVDIYRLQDDGHFSDDYGLLSDLRQSAISVASFIAGGRERGGASEFIRYLSKAKSTAALLRTQLIVSRDIGYLAEGDYLDFEDKINRITAMVNGLIKAIRNKSRGTGRSEAPEMNASRGSGSRTSSGSEPGSGAKIVSQSKSAAVSAQDSARKTCSAKSLTAKTPLQS